MKALRIRLAKWLFNVLFFRVLVKRPVGTADFEVAEGGRLYLQRWYLIPRNRVLNLYLHCFHSSDDARAHHDHPWLFNASFILRGGYREHTIARGGIHRYQDRGMGDLAFRVGPSPHRIELVREFTTGIKEQCWTLFLTGPTVRTWGFHCRDMWVPWQLWTGSQGCGDTNGKAGAP